MRACIIMTSQKPNDGDVCSFGFNNNVKRAIEAKHWYQNTYNTIRGFILKGGGNHVSLSVGIIGRFQVGTFLFFLEANVAKDIILFCVRIYRKKPE